MPRKKDTVTINGYTLPMNSPRVKSAQGRLAANRKDDSALGLAQKDAGRRDKIATIVGKPQVTSVRKYR